MDWMKKMVVAVKKPDSSTFWQNVGIMGSKNGKIWWRLNVIPVGNTWEGFGSAVDEDKEKGTYGKTAKADKPMPKPIGEDDGAEEAPF